MDQSPAVTSNHPLQTTFKRPRKASPDREDHVNNTSITKEQRNSAIRVFRELHRYNFRGVGKLQNLNTDKKKESSRRPCSLKLGNNSSNEYVVNYSHQKAIRPDPKAEITQAELLQLHSHCVSKISILLHCMV